MDFISNLHRRNRRLQLLVCALFATLHVVSLAALMPYFRPSIVTDEEMMAWNAAERALINVWSLDTQHAPMLISITVGVALVFYAFLRISKILEEKMGL